MYSKLISWSRGLYLAGIVLALVLVIPTAWFPFQLAKVAVFSIFLLAACVVFVLGGGMRELLRAHGLYGALLVALLPLSYVLSTFFSIDKSVALSGFGIEADTIVFVTLLFLAYLVSFSLFRTLRTVRLLLVVVLWALFVASVFQCISIVFGSAAIPLATFADRSVNLVGKWNDLGLLVGLLFMLLLVQVELTSLSNLRRIVIGVVLVVLAVLISVINFFLVWALVLGFSLLVGIIKMLIGRGTEASQNLSLGRGIATRLPWFSIASVLISVLFLFFGSTVNINLTNLFPVSSLEVRPSYASTITIINAARAAGQGGGTISRVFVGTGPNTFGQEWLLHRPAEVNQSPFWNLDFNVGFSTFITALGSVGLIGIIAWLIPLLLVLAGLVRVMRLNILNREDKIIATTLGTASLFLFLSILFYVPSQNIILLAFVLSGATFGFLWRQGQSSTATQPEIEEQTAQVHTLLPIGAGVVLIVLALWVGVTTNRRLIAEAYIGSGAASLASGNVDQALGSAARAQGIEKTGDALRLLIQANSAKLQQLAAATSTPVAELQQQFAATVQSAIAAAQSAQNLNPNDYRPTLALAQLYDYLASLKVENAAQTAGQVYQTTMAKNPTDPEIPLALARLYATAGDQKNTTLYLSQALTLKPNYTDAILLVVQLDVAQNDLPNAIKAAVAATQTAPGVAPIWFELGLLYYSQGDAQSAATSLEKAIAIAPDYANAKYFLGLSYYILKRNNDAVKQFQDLAQSNPDSAEVKLILANLESGKQPFEGAQPPVTPTPQKRTTAPVSQ